MYPAQVSMEGALSYVSLSWRHPPTKEETILLCITVLLLCITLHLSVLLYLQYILLCITLAVMHPMWRQPSITARQQTHHVCLWPQDNGNYLTAKVRWLKDKVLKKILL